MMFTSRGVRLLIVTVSALAIGVSAAACAGDRPVAAQDDILSADDLIETPSREVSIFYPSTDAIAEERVVLPTDEEPELAALQILFEAKPQGEDVVVTLPPAAVNSVTVRDGLATVDFSSDVLVTTADPTTQQVAIIAILYTLGQFPGVERVSFSVEGRTSGSIGDKKIEEFWGEVTLRDMPWSIVGTERIDEPAASTQGE